MLTKSEVLNITETIDRAEISFSHLRDELIDHVCCEIENRMNMGFSFTDAFEDIKPKVGLRELQKVQENTLLLIDKKYRIMKRVMKISGTLSLIGLTFGTLARLYHFPGANIVMAVGFLVLCFLFLPSSIAIMHKENKTNSKILLYVSAYIGSIGFSLGVFFKLMHWPGAGYIETLGVTVLSFLFFPALWFTVNKKITSPTERIAVFIGIAGGSLHFLGILFKMQHWPGAANIFILSIVLVVFVYLPMYTYLKFKDDVHVNERFIYIIFAFTFFILLTLLLQLQFSYDITKVFKNDATARVLVTNYNESLTQQNKVLPSDSAMQQNINETIITLTKTCEILDSVSEAFITSKFSNIPYDKTNTALICENLLNVENNGVFESVMFGNGNNSPAYVLKQKLVDLQQKTKVLKLTSEKKSILSLLLDTSVPADKSDVSWEDYTFRNKQPYFQYRTLLWLKERLTIAGYELTH